MPRKSILTTSIRSSDGVRLHVRTWPIEQATGTLLIIPGYTEHSSRYEHVADFFNARGMNVLGVDLRGHGMSEGRRGHVGQFEDYRCDMAAAWAYAAERSGGAERVTILGHSIGGLVICDWLLTKPDPAPERVILSSPFFGLTRPLRPMTRWVAQVLSRVWPTFRVRLRFPAAQVCRDPRLLRVYRRDPLVNRWTTPRWVNEAQRKTEDVMARAGELRGAFLVLYAGDDVLADPDRTEVFVNRLETPYAEERLHGYAHEILNEPPEAREPVLERMWTWITAP